MKEATLSPTDAPLVPATRERILAHMQRDPLEDPERLRPFPAAVAKLLRAATAHNAKDRPHPLEFGREFAKLF